MKRGRPCSGDSGRAVGRAPSMKIDHLNGVLMTDRMLEVVPQEESAARVRVSKVSDCFYGKPEFAVPSLEILAEQQRESGSSNPA